MTDATINVLLVEDDDIDAEAVERAFAEHCIENPIYRAKDGLEALRMLRGENDYVRVPRPFIVLLDMNMPRMNGIEFLDELRLDEMHYDSVVFVLTTSDDERDKIAAYRQHVAAYFVKSNVGDDYIDLMNFIKSYWRIVEFPPLAHVLSRPG